MYTECPSRSTLATITAPVMAVWPATIKHGSAPIGAKLADDLQREAAAGCHY